MTILTAILAFLITIGVLVAIHEYGHFWVARKLGVKVLRYSVGFGKPIWTYVSKKDPDQTEYVVAALPLGGYVRMVDEREGDVPEEDLPRAFNRQVVWKRFLIVLAGPMANFLFAIFAYAVMYMVGIEGIKPYVNKVIPETPAAIAGFQHQDRILAINGVEVDSLADTAITMLDEYLNDKSNVEVSVETESGTPAIRKLDLSGLELLQDDKDHLERIGFTPLMPYLPMVAQVMPESAGADAGLKAEDKIISLGGHVFEDWSEFKPLIQKNGENPIEMVIERDGKPMTLSVTPRNGIHEGKEFIMVGIAIGGYVSKENHDKLSAIVSHGPLESLQQGAVKTWQMTALTFKFIGRLFTGEASVKNISGPVTIADYAGKSIIISFSVFIGFLAIVSISLGVMNLLPVPMLDGGHLMFYTIEMVKGSPVSEAVQEVGMRIGVAMVGALMILAFYNDILKLLK